MMSFWEEVLAIVIALAVMDVLKWLLLKLIDGAKVLFTTYYGEF